MTAIPREQTPADRPESQDMLRPSFLTGALWAGLLTLIALPIGFGGVEAQTAFTPADWYAHEGLYGYLAAIVTGFCLCTAPMSGPKPVVLMLAWLAGRLAILGSGTIGVVVAGGIDSVFLVLAAAIAVRTSLADRRILPQAGVLLAMAAGNVIFHLGLPEAGTRIGIAAVVMLVTLVSGRPIGRGGETVPADGLDLVDIIALALSGLALLTWIVLPGTMVTGILMLLAGLAQVLRLVGWVRSRSGQGTLTLIQQLAYGLIPLGFLALGSSAFGHDQPGPANIRAWLISAVGILALAMVIHADLGPEKRPATVRMAAFVIYAAVATAFVLRLFNGWIPLLAPIAGTAWMVAFAVFVLGYLPLLAQPRAAAS
jgi:uncharacterized protein involved in response to NO